MILLMNACEISAEVLQIHQINATKDTTKTPIEKNEQTHQSYTPMVVISGHHQTIDAED